TTFPRFERPLPVHHGCSACDIHARTALKYCECHRLIFDGLCSNALVGSPRARVLNIVLGLVEGRIYAAPAARSSDGRGEGASALTSRCVIALILHPRPRS